MNKKCVIVVSGIDTDIGKTVVTGMIARSLIKQGYNASTQKMVQTGCVGISEDIAEHRRLMGVALTEDDYSGVSCPYLFPEPCSPHLAAELSGTKIDPAKITAATEKMLQHYDVLLIEGAGGLSVPLTLDYTFLEYMMAHQYPLVLVSSPRLGSINHTLNALEILAARGISLAALVYNLHGSDGEVPAMVANSREVMSHYMGKLHSNANIIDFPSSPSSTAYFDAAVLGILEGISPVL